jgi:trimeric autotransporter adhesin
MRPVNVPRFLACAVAIVAAVRAASQCPTPAWSAEAAITGPGVLATTRWDPDGAGPTPASLVAGGQFTSIGGTSASNVALFDGATWQPLGAGTDGAVFALANHNGELIVAGNFMSAGGVPATTRIASWNGSSWHALGNGLTNWPWVLTTYNGDLIAGGSLMSTSPVALSGVARWDGTTWHPLGSGINGGVVFALTVVSGELVVGGSFSFAGGIVTPNLARWNGSAWFAAPTGPNNLVQDMLVWDEHLVIAGNFTSAGGVPASRVARLTAGVWHPLGAGLGAPFTPTAGVALETYAGRLVVGGEFSGAGGLPCNNVAAFDGHCWTPLGAGLTGTASTVRDLIVHDGALIAAGTFTASGSTPLTHLARWSEPIPVVSFSQPGGPGSGVLVSNAGLVPGREYYNVASFDACAGCPGGGPYGGLCFNDLGFLFSQFAYPVGSHPFHFVAAAPTLVTGPYVAPTGVTLEAVCADITGGALGCLSHVRRFTVQ